jgi:pimeloyl-ACP methyl ester carboxylesterase
MWMMSGSFTGRSMTRSFLEKFTAHPEQMDESVINVYWWSLHEGTTRASSGGEQLRLLAQFDRYQKALRRLHVPAMVVWGKKDPVLNYSKIRAQFARDLEIPAERIHILEDASHYV